VKRLVILETIADIQEYFTNNEDYVVIGKGSNIVLNNNGVYGDVVKISSDLFPISCTSTLLEAGAGIAVNELMKACQVEGLSGLEFMAGVPASVGGMVAMNFGCWGDDISQKLQSVLAIDSRGDLFELDADMCQFSYRDSLFQHQGLIVLKATFNVSKSSREDVKQTINENIKKRLESQPLRGRTFGSIFKNPKGDFAARILDELGLKGYQKGAVSLSEQHANFMINNGDATFDDVMAFISEIQAIVKEKKGLMLEPEVKLIR
jgi:UDP-N-acetylmuramate dehydrogenase